MLGKRKEGCVLGDLEPEGCGELEADGVSWGENRQWKARVKRMLGKERAVKQQEVQVLELLSDNLDQPEILAAKHQLKFIRNC